MGIKQKRHFFFFVFLFIGKFIFAQFEIPKSPSFIYPINDYAKVLSSLQLKKLNQKLLVYNKQTSSQILVVLLDDLKGEDPNMLATNWGQKWKIGKKGKDNGMVILISTGDKKVAIQNGYGLEAYFTDALSRRVIEEHLKPHLEKQNYYNAINKGLDAIFKILEGAYKNLEKETPNYFSWGNVLAVILIIGFLIFLFSGGKGDKNNFRRNLAEMLFQILILLASSGGRSGGRSNSSGGKGFGGGGRFGGGGASSGW